jgi:ketosteroid isomerase-like protein
MYTLLLRQNACNLMADLEILRALNAGYIRSVSTSDVAWFAQHLAEDFVNSNADGTLSDRSGFLEQIAQPLAVSEFGCEDVRIRILGEVAIIHGRTTYRKADGRSAVGRYTDVWARRRGLWLCVCAHVTRG